MTTALYRRYRPETFEDVIGQEHVTEPLMTALRKDRVSHAYLFSGPRGCGKTTSARILARCLNCAEGPTATPCGRCESCRDLARDGAGSLDVIEMDAASHGGVDHARDLRERATFAPVRDRYKIFIIDEAHMVTREGFNALLKIVEEPPEHIKFIFATTEPSKVLTTIRSRTHHYPFRLVPTEPLMHYLERLCTEEHVPVAPGVLSLVVRAGGGSVRDTLSVLDQLMAGSDEGGIGYDLAVALLGYTHAALLDDVVDAFASGDAATVFRAVDRVVQTGQDPRRFVEDLLERFRDLIIVDAVPESAGNILHGMPQDQVARLRNQASQLGAAELSRAADITNTALTEMTGATSPQLHLELLCARILLPSSEDTTRGVTARVDRLERRLSIGRGPAPAGRDDQHADAPAPADPASRPDPAPQPPRAYPADDTRRPGAEQPATAAAQAPARAEPAPRAEPEPSPGPEPVPGHRPASGTVPSVGPGTERAPRPAPDGDAVDRSPAPGTGRPPGQDTPLADEAADGIDMLRASWPEIVNALADIRRVAWFTVQRGTPQSFDGKVLRIMFDAEGDLMNFPRFEDDLRQAVQQILGIDCRAEAVPSGGGHGRGGTQRSPEPPSTSPGGRGAPGPGAAGTGTTPPDRGPSGGGAPPRGRGVPDRAQGTSPGPQQQPSEPGPRRAPDRGAVRDQDATGPRGASAQPAGQHGPRGEQDGPPGGRDAWSTHGRPATDTLAEWADPAWAEEPVHSWSVAAIPQGGDADPASAPRGTGPAPRPAPRSEEQTGTSPADRGEPAPGPESSPGGGRPAGPAAPHGSPARRAADPDPHTTPAERPARSAGRSPHDDVPPPEEPPDPDDPPYPEDLDEAPPEQWRPATAALRGAPTRTASPPATAAVPPRTSPAGTAASTARRAPPGRETPPDAPAVEDAADPRERLSFRERHAAAIAAGRQAPPAAAPPGGGDVEWDDAFVPGSDDEALEDSTLYGRAAIERILGGTLVEERDLHTGD